MDSEEVSVRVTDGVATLTGTVESWVERSSATEDAFEGGAARVVNHRAVCNLRDNSGFEFLPLLAGWVSARGGLLSLKGRTFSLDFHPIPVSADHASCTSRL